MIIQYIGRSQFTGRTHLRFRYLRLFSILSMPIKEIVNVHRRINQTKCHFHLCPSSLRPTPKRKQKLWASAASTVDINFVSTASAPHIFPCGCGLRFTSIVELASQAPVPAAAVPVNAPDPSATIAVEGNAFLWLKIFVTVIPFL